jgi:phage FluMu protein Com
MKNYFSIIKQEKFMMSVKCPWCGTVNEYKHTEYLFKDNHWSELTGFTEWCWYCKNLFGWNKENGTHKETKENLLSKVKI